MNREKFIIETDNLINDSKMVLGSFLYMCILNDKTMSKDERNKIIEKYEEFKNISFSTEYQKWYSKASEIIKIIVPHRYEEFKNLYIPQRERKILTLLNYTIFDAIRGITSIDRSVNIDTAHNLIITQINILKSAREVLEHRLNELSNLLEFDIFEKEINSAKYLLKQKYLRAAGAICGVIIEKHLLNMLINAGEKPSKKDPSINDLNIDLYSKNLIDVTQHKQLIFLGDIRNKCDHNKKKDPTKDEVEELIRGTEKIIQTY